MKTKIDRYEYILIPLLTAFCSVLLFEYTGIGDSDLYWHIALGRSICELKGLPATDIFSWYGEELGLPMTAHSWLGSLALFFCSLFVPKAEYVAIFVVALCGAIFALVLLIALGKTLPTTFMRAIVLCGLTLMVKWAGRPQSFGIVLFLIAYLLLLHTYSKPTTKLRWAFPILTVVWANLHGGSLPILFAFNFLFLVVAMLPDFELAGCVNRNGGKIRVARMAELLCTNMVAGLLNPYGWRLYLYFFVTNNETAKSMASEWTPARLNNPVVAISLIALFLVFALRIPVQAHHLLPILACLVMTAKYIRIRSYLVVAMIPLISSLAKYAEDSVLKNCKVGQRLTMILLALSVSVSAYFALSGAPAMVNNPAKVKDRMSPELVEYLTELAPQRLYTSYNDGGIVIYHGFQSFVDSRADLFPDDVLLDSNRFMFASVPAQNGMHKILDKYQFDAVLLRRENCTAAEFLSMMPEWEVTWQDDYYTVYAKCF